MPGLTDDQCNAIAETVPLTFTEAENTRALIRAGYNASGADTMRAALAHVLALEQARGAAALATNPELIAAYEKKYMELYPHVMDLIRQLVQEGP